MRGRILYLNSSFLTNIPIIRRQDDEEFFTGRPKDTSSVIDKSDNNATSFVEKLEEKYDQLSDPPLIENGRDWRRTGCILETQSQRSCGSCFSFAIMSLIEVTICLNPKLIQNLDKPRNLSPQLLVDCKSSCDGGSTCKSYKYMEQLGYAITNDCYSYNAVQGQCKIDQIKDRSCIVPLTGENQKLIQVELKSEEEMRNHLEKHGAVLTGMVVNKNFRKYHRGILMKGDDTDSSGSHAVVIIGYGTSSAGVKYWLAKNSWRQQWGHGGYFMVERGKDVYNMETRLESFRIKTDAE